MHFSTLSTFLLSVVSVYAQQNILVTVGDGGLVYNPETVTAAVGDIIIFEFRGGNHTVTQSTFAEPCTLMTTPREGIDSGFLAVGDNPTEFSQWSITIDDATAPLWFYCRQGQHCQSGMVFSVNPTEDRSHEAFKANAANAVSGGGAADASSAGSSDTAEATSSSSDTTGATATSSDAASQTPSSPETSGTDSAANEDSSDGAFGMRASAAGVLSAVAILSGLML